MMPKSKLQGEELKKHLKWLRKTREAIELRLDEEMVAEGFDVGTQRTSRLMTFTNLMAHAAKRENMDLETLVSVVIMAFMAQPDQMNEKEKADV